MKRAQPTWWRFRKRYAGVYPGGHPRPPEPWIYVHTVGTRRDISSICRSYYAAVGVGLASWDIDQMSGKPAVNLLVAHQLDLAGGALTAYFAA